VATMKAVQIAKAGDDFELVERDIPEPGPNEVRVKVEACGICHGDALAKFGTWPGLTYPRVPGHEVAGRIDKTGSGVSNWAAGERVGVGWHGGHCFRCEPCRRGDFINCEKSEITGLTRDGGYAEFLIARQEALARIPGELNSSDAAPLLCAGVTTFNSLRHSGARAGDLVAVQGVGGLGHLGIQFASRMGFRTVAISSGREKQDLALKLGASRYIDSSQADPATELAKMGGAQVILATAPSSKAIVPLVEGLARRGKLLIVAGASEPMAITPVRLLSGRSIAGWAAGSAKDSEDALNFATLTGARPMIETYPLERAREAFARMMANQARFRVVLTLGH